MAVLATYNVKGGVGKTATVVNLAHRAALTGLDVNRGVHFKHPEVYSDFKSQAEAASYLDRVKEALADGYPEIFIPGAAQYEDALDLHVNKALAGQETSKEALDAVAKEWSAITDRLGREKQIQVWKQAQQSYKTAGLIK